MTTSDSHRPTLMIAATQPEVSGVARALGVPMKASHIHTPDWLLVQAGIGAQRTVAALNKSVRQKQVSRVIHFGFAGGLSPELNPGDMPRFTTIAEPSGRLIAIDQPIPRVLAPGETPPVGPRLLSVPYLVHRPADKQRLCNYHHAIAVDMESFAIAQACAQMKLPYHCIRAISDTADMALPIGSESWLDQQGNIRHLRVMAYLLTHPRWIRKIMHLGETSKIAAESMTPQVLAKLQSPQAAAPALKRESQPAATVR